MLQIQVKYLYESFTKLQSSHVTGLPLLNCKVP